MSIKFLVLGGGYFGSGGGGVPILFFMGAGIFSEFLARTPTRKRFPYSTVYECLKPFF